MIDIVERIEIASPPEKVWTIVSDPEQVASCISGCELGEGRDDGGFDATVGVKFGGIRVRFAVLVYLETDELERIGRLRVVGADQQGATRVKGGGEFVVNAVGEEASVVELSGQVDITGKLAGVIAAGASVVVNRMSQEFATNLTELCDPTPPPQVVVTADGVFGLPGVRSSVPAREWGRSLVKRVRRFLGALVSKFRGQRPTQAERSHR